MQGQLSSLEHLSSHIPAVFAAFLYFYQRTDASAQQCVCSSSADLTKEFFWVMHMIFSMNIFVFRSCFAIDYALSFCTKEEGSSLKTDVEKTGRRVFGFYRLWSELLKILFLICSKLSFSTRLVVKSGGKNHYDKRGGETEMDKKKYLRRMRELREDNDYVQKQVAASLNIDQRVYSRYETGINSLPVALVYDLCEFYGVSADYLLGISDRK